LLASQVAAGEVVVDADGDGDRLAFRQGGGPT
jgi:hypothetical protein